MLAIQSFSRSTGAGLDSSRSVLVSIFSRIGPLAVNVDRGNLYLSSVFQLFLLIWKKEGFYTEFCLNFTSKSFWCVFSPVVSHKLPLVFSKFCFSHLTRKYKKKKNTKYKKK